MEDMELKRGSKYLREFKKVYMIEVLEGKGTPEDPYRGCRYFFDDDTEMTFIAKYDPTTTDLPKE